MQVFPESEYLFSQSDSGLHHPFVFKVFISQKMRKGSIKKPYAFLKECLLCIFSHLLSVRISYKTILVSKEGWKRAPDLVTASLEQFHMRSAWTLGC
jgi:hypothetical protein